MKSEVKHDKTNNRFYLLAEGYTVQMDYSLEEDIINFFHTYTPPAIRGRGLASEVAKQGLEYAKENNPVLLYNLLSLKMKDILNC